MKFGEEAGKCRYRVWPIFGPSANKTLIGQIQGGKITPRQLIGSDDKVEAERYARLHGMRMVEWLNHPSAAAYYKDHRDEEMAYIKRHQRLGV